MAKKPYKSSAKAGKGYKNVAKIKDAKSMDELVDAIKDLKPEERDNALINVKAFGFSQKEKDN